MVRTPTILVSAFLILAMGCFVADGKVQKLAKVKTAEVYWAETGLQSQALEELLQDTSCKISERQFLACVNAIQSAALKFGFQLNMQGQLVPVDPATSKKLTEKELLTPWKERISATGTIPELSFVQIWKEFFSEHIGVGQRSYVVGLGINGFFSVAKDPHTYILPASMYTEVVAKANPKSLSIGIVLGRNEKHYFIKKVIEKSSSALAGVKKGDAILEVNGKNADELSAQEISEQLRGEAGSVLELEVLRHGQKMAIEITRSEQTLPTVSTQVLEGVSPIGVLTINKFAINACREVKKGLSQLKVQGIRGLLLDLRDNPGGQMEEAACVAGLFIGPGQKVFDIKPLALDVQEETSFTSEEKIYDGKMAVLINSGSASASEIVAGVLQHYKRAVLVGERTFGKGSFQEGELWEKNEKLALFETKGFYYLPSGKSPQMTGLQPDVAVNFKDRFALREEDQFWSSLKAPALMTADAFMIPLDLQPQLATCLSFESDLLPSEDPEMKEGHRVLNCRGIAERGTR